MNLSYTVQSDVKCNEDSHEISGRRGFTLLEIMIVMIIIGLLASIAVPLFKEIRENSRSANVVNNFRVFSSSFRIYEMENGEWPDDVGPGSLPSVMQDYIKSHDFEQPTAIGGSWDWEEGSVNGITAGVSIRNHFADGDQLVDIDRDLDDGNLSSGKFRQFGGLVMYIIEE